MTPIFDEIRASDLTDWAKTAECERWTPSLIRQLVLVSGAKVASCRFLTHEQADLGGWDGITLADGNGLYVPQGRAGWELSKEVKVLTKADKDIAERSKAPGEFKVAEDHYRAVTLRIWPKRKLAGGKVESSGAYKESWARWQKKRYGWASVAVLDAIDLAAWIASSPGVSIWVSELLHRRLRGAYSLITHWNALATLRPNLMPKAFLAGRRSFTAALDTLIEGLPGSLSVQSWSIDDVRDAIAAWWAERNSVNNPQTFVPIGVTSDEAWQYLAHTDRPLLLLADNAVELRPEMISAAISRGHYVVYCITGAPRDGAACSLGELSRDMLAIALVESGIDHAEANRIAQEMVGSGVAFKRLLLGRSADPAWAKVGSAAQVAPVALLGSWDGDHAGDCNKVALLFGESYGKVEQLLLPRARVNDPLLRRKGKRWQVAGRGDAWQWLAPWLTAAHFRKFAGVAQTVLTEINPRYKLRPSKRPFAAIAGATPKYSVRLRRALGETLCLLTVRPHTMPDGRSSQILGRAIISKVLASSKDWRLWASLDFALLYIAEAAPDIFLNALEVDVKRPASAMVKLLGQGGGPIFGDHPHVEVMWALETLLWEREWAPRAIAVLARLAARDPGDNSYPRPMSVLREAFLPWMPQCQLNAEERRTMLESILKLEPEIGWKLLSELLPKSHDVSSPSQRPSYRKAPDSQPVSDHELIGQAVHATRTMVGTAGRDLDRWQEIIANLHRFPDETFTLALNRISQLASQLDAAGRTTIWKALRSESARHRHFGNADWAMPGPRLSRLEEIVAAIEPQNPLLKYAWLFDQHFIELPGIQWDTPMAENSRLQEEARVKVLKEIIAFGGMKAIRTFSLQAAEAGLVGSLIASRKLLLVDKEVLPSWLKSGVDRLVRFAWAYAAARFSSDGWPWLKKLRPQLWKPETFAILSNIFPFGPQMWSNVEALGPAHADAYWRRIQPFVSGGTAQDIERAAGEFLKHGRPGVALDCVSSAFHAKIQPPIDSVLAVLEAMQKGLIEDKNLRDAFAGPNSLMPHWTNRLIQASQNSPAITPDRKKRVADLEWFFLASLRNEIFPKFLIERLSRDPAFFLEIVRMHSKPDVPPKMKGARRSKKMLRKAEQARKLLESFIPLPGFDVTGKFDEAVFFAWIGDVRQVSKKAGFARSTEYRLGKLLSHSPADPAGFWPAAPICRLLSSDSTEPMNASFTNAVFTMNNWPEPKGSAVRVAVFGGIEHKAARLREVIAKLQVPFPTVAALLSGVVESYQHFAERFREDED